MPADFEPIALPVSQAAKLIGRSSNLLYQEIKAGRLRAYAPQRSYRTKKEIAAGSKQRLVKYVLMDDLKAWVRGEHNNAAA